MIKRGLLALFLSGTLFYSADAAWGRSAGWESADNEDQLYDEGTRSMNDGRWEDADAAFAKVARLKGKRADAALYWRAYAENKASRAPDALQTCSELRQLYPKSQWLKECGALEIDIHKTSGKAIQPDSESDEDLKLLALNALMQQDPGRALPIAKTMLTGNHSEKVKERALFVLAQSPTKEAQDLLRQVFEGHIDPDLQVKAIHMEAAMQGRRASGLMTELYKNSNDLRVKKAILQSYLITGDHDRLLEVAKGESDASLVQTAIHTLGAMGAAQDLLTLYRSSNNPQTKKSIIDAFIMCGSKGKETVAEIAASEQDSGLRARAIRNIGISGGHSASPTLIDIYRKYSDMESKNAALEGLFVAGDAPSLIEIARSEKDPAMKKRVVEKLSVMNTKEANDYMIELLK